VVICVGVFVLVAGCSSGVGLVFCVGGFWLVNGVFI